MAALEILGIREYFGRNASRVMATRFRRALEKSIAAIRMMPESGSPWELENLPDAGIRTWLVKGFENYVIYYRIRATRIEILHVLHGAQDAEQRLQDLE